MQYQFKRSQLVNTDLKTLWDFASSPKNLSRITPDYMNFKIKSSLPDKGMYPGMMIIYTVCPLLKLPMTWITEITSVENGSYFVDEQRVGPYKMWHHEHHFEQKENGVLMTDIVTYIPPLGILGALANLLFIKKQLNTIFEYRFKAMDKLFPKIA